jgi:hypothetical protein
MNIEPASAGRQARNDEPAFAGRQVLKLGQYF